MSERSQKVDLAVSQARAQHVAGSRRLAFGRCARAGRAMWRLHRRAPCVASGSDDGVEIRIVAVIASTSVPNRSGGPKAPVGARKIGIRTGFTRPGESASCGNRPVRRATTEITRAQQLKNRANSRYLALWTRTSTRCRGWACCGIRHENGLSILLSRTNHVAHHGTSSAGADMTNYGRDETNYGRDEKMRLALVPPKPNEFVMAYLIGMGAARCMIRFNALSASGVVRLIVGGAT